MKALIARATAEVYPTAPKLVYDAASQPGIRDAIYLPGQCYLCGSRFDIGVPLAAALRDSFNNRDIAACPDGQGFCCPCAFSFNERLNIPGHDKPQKFRTYSHFVSDSGWLLLSKASKARMQEFLLTPHAGWWAACITESGQKHLLFRCPVNYGPGRFRIQFEERVVETDRITLRALLEPIESLLALGASKTGIERGEYGQRFFLATDLKEWSRLEQVITRGRGSSPFALALFLAQKGPV